jgi:hypothetical protein
MHLWHALQEIHDKMMISRTQFGHFILGARAHAVTTRNGDYVPRATSELRHHKTNQRVLFSHSFYFYLEERLNINAIEQKHH